jgi:hypothetical protein
MWSIALFIGDLADGQHLAVVHHSLAASDVDDPISGAQLAKEFYSVLQTHIHIRLPWAAIEKTMLTGDSTSVGK